MKENISRETDPKVIKGSPTKDLFIYVLTRDLSLEDAINDLIDNSIDGAKRMRPQGDYEGLRIDLSLNETSFKIVDNCGGIPIKVAREYAFRFGRAEGVENTKFSIGQFGVGMKRAFFKLGETFYVHSVAEKSEFTVIVSVDDWLNKKDEDGNDDWSFQFEEDYRENVSSDPATIGTDIEVTPLHEEIKEYILETNLPESLKLDIERKHMENIYKGMSITVNGDLLRSIRPEFRVSDDVKIAKFEKSFDNGVDLEILCGIGDPKEDEGGWYIFCNDRLLLGPEQSALSGWTGSNGDGVASYHHQYRYFRGIVYFRSENSFNLPWNTSKNDIDASSRVFLSARGKMIEMMRPVIKVLNLVKKDRETGEDGGPKNYQPYVSLVNNTHKVGLSEISNAMVDSKFRVPKLERVVDDSEKHVTISYKKQKSLVEQLKKIYSASSNRELGEMTFDYFVEQEDIDYE